MQGLTCMQEDGVRTAIQAIYRDMEYAKTLIKRKTFKDTTTGVENEPESSNEESWTFIGDEGDPELIRRIQEWEPPSQGRTTAQSIDNGSHISRSKLGQSDSTLSSTDKTGQDTPDFNADTAEADSEDGPGRSRKRNSLRFGLIPKSSDSSPMRFFRRPSRG